MLDTPHLGLTPQVPLLSVAFRYWYLAESENSGQIFAS